MSADSHVVVSVLGDAKKHRGLTDWLFGRSLSRSSLPKPHIKEPPPPADNRFSSPLQQAIGLLRDHEERLKRLKMEHEAGVVSQAVRLLHEPDLHGSNNIADGMEDTQLRWLEAMEYVRKSDADARPDSGRESSWSRVSRASRISRISRASRASGVSRRVNEPEAMPASPALSSMNEEEEGESAGKPQLISTMVLKGLTTEATTRVNHMLEHELTNWCQEHCCFNFSPLSSFVSPSLSVACSSPLSPRLLSSGACPSQGV